jgi:hypothetical protein
MSVNDNKFTITNYTLQGHALYPGKVVRTVVEECNKIKIITNGVGLSRLYLYSPLVGYLTGKINSIYGSILFNNVDSRIKDAFNKQ